MFDFLSWGHLLVIGLAVFFIFGPERLPTVARDAARGLQRARAAVTAVREQLGDELGEDFRGLRELDVRRYHPGVILRNQLLGVDGEAKPARGQAGAADMAAPTPPAPRPAGPTGAVDPWNRMLPPPFDVDAT